MNGGERKDKIAVVVGTITNDLRILNLPKLKVSVWISLPGMVSGLFRSVL